MQNLPYENEFDLHLNELVGKIDFRTKGFALVLVLKQRQVELGLLSLILKTVALPTSSRLLGVQDGGSEKTLANSRSRVSKNIEDFVCFKMAAGLVIG